MSYINYHTAGNPYDVSEMRLTLSVFHEGEDEPIINQSCRIIHPSQPEIIEEQWDKLAVELYKRYRESCASYVPLDNLKRFTLKVNWKEPTSEELKLYLPSMLKFVTPYNQHILNQNFMGISKLEILVQIDNPETAKLYKFDSNGQLNSGSDHGINLWFPDDHEIPARAIGYTIDFGVIGETSYNHGYLLIPRSSIGKTPLRQCNSVGLIESTYRGHLMVKVDNVSDQPYKVTRGQSLFQIVQPSLRNHWVMQLVPFCGASKRGTGGFGSTDAKPTA